MSQFLAGILIKLRQPRTMWLLLIAIVLGVVFGYSFWDQFWRDTTTRYVRSDASLYARVSVPKYYMSEQFDQGVATFLRDMKLPLDAHDIKREIAFVQYQNASSSLSQVIVRTDRLARVKENLRKAGLVYTQVSGEHLVISLNASNAIVANSHDKLMLKNTGGKPFVGYLSPSFATDHQDLLSQIIGGASQNSMVWYGKASRSGVTLYPDSINAFQTPPLIQNSNYIVWSSDQIDISQYVMLMKQLAKMGEWYYTPEISQELVSQKFKHLSFIAIPHPVGSHWALTAYDWRLVLDIDGVWTPELKTAVERLIASVVAFELPQPSIRQLSDGTQIKVIRPNINNWAFKGDATKRALEVSERALIITEIQNKGELIITNAPDSSFPDAINQEYGQVPTLLLPNLAPWGYLKGFSTLSVDNKGVFLR